MSSQSVAKQPVSAPAAPVSTIGSLLLIGMWFGIATGLVEGAGLLLFQRINWARWGPIMHVSREILWISPVVDLCFFLVLALLAGLLGRLISRVPAILSLVFLLTFLATYDWLATTGRLYHRSRLVLAFGVAVAFIRWLRKREAPVVQFWRRTAPCLLGVLVLTIVGIQGGRWLQERKAVAALPPAATGSPNVLVIVVDTLRADHLSSYGYQRPTSPSIDHIAAQGTVFENAVSTCSWSLPSHVSLLTGHYTFEHGVENVQPEPWLGWDGRALGGYLSLAEALQRRGYRTGAFSANRTYFSADLGFGRGFIHFEDYFHSPADMFVRTFFGKEFSRTYLIRSNRSLVKRVLRALGFTSLLDQDAEGSGSFGGAFGVRKRADVIDQELLGWIDRGPQRPFFAFLNYFDVHSPYGGPPSYRKPSWQQGGVLDRYDESVKYVDDYIGLLMQELQRRKLDQNTLLIITSDHGEALGAHGLSYHGATLYWELVHVPLIVWWPGHVLSGVRIPRPVSNNAVPATVMELLGDGKTGTFPGPALSDLWQNPGAETNWPDPVSEVAKDEYSVIRKEAAEKVIPTAKTGAMKSLVTSQWHYILHREFGAQLYDWAKDPGELHNLAGTPVGRQAVLHLASSLEDVLVGDPPSGLAGRLASAPSLHEGTALFSRPTAANGRNHIDDYYQFTAIPGEKVSAEIRTQPKAPHRLDSVIAIEDNQGNLLQTCRNRADDHLSPPGVSDPTPDAFDDVCLNQVAPGEDADSRLEVLVTGNSGSPVELYLRVSDWNGHVDPGVSYQIAIHRLQ